MLPARRTDPAHDVALQSALDRLTGGVAERPDTPDGWVTAVRRLPARPAEYAPFPEGVDPLLCDVLRDIKANSSGWIHQTFPELGKFAWQEGYAAFTVSQTQLEIVQRYIANQEKHHRKRSFQQELVELLQKHGIEFDERGTHELKGAPGNWHLFAVR